MLPALVEPEELAGGTAVVIDVLRASTTMIHALAHGAARIIPCESVAEARAVATRFPRQEVLLGGERGGGKIDGFDLDNSPRCYTPEVVAGKTIVFTTTNGTLALRRAAAADTVLVGALVNLRAVVSRLWDRPGPVHLLCAGTDGCLTAEDILCAGLLVLHLTSPETAGKRWRLDVRAEMARDFARRHGGSPADILRTLRESRGGRNLLELGFEADLPVAARLDSHPVVPRYERQTGAVTLLAPH